MRWLNQLFRSTSPKHGSHVRRLGQRFERLESREMLTSSPLPVLMVIADRQDFYSRSAPVAFVAPAAPAAHSGGVNVLMGDGSVRFVSPYPSGFNGGVRVAVGDVTGNSSTRGLTAGRGGAAVADDVIVDGRIITAENFDS